MSAPATKRSITRQHDWIDERSQALHQAVAEKIRFNPDLLRMALQNLERWTTTGSKVTKPLFEEWKRIIQTWPLEKLLELLGEQSERASQLRQASPFTGILSQREREEIFQRYETL